MAKWIIGLIIGTLIIVVGGYLWVNKLVLDFYQEQADKLLKSQVANGNIVLLQEDGVEKTASIMAGKEYHVPRAYLMNQWLTVFSDQMLIYMRWPGFTPPRPFEKGEDAKARLNNAMHMLVYDAAGTTSHAFRYGVLRGFELKNVYRDESDYALTPRGEVYGLHAYTRTTHDLGNRVEPGDPVYRDGRQVEKPTEDERLKRRGEVYTDQPVAEVSGSVPPTYLVCGGDMEHPSPGCSMHFTENGLLYDVTFRKVRLPEWKTIREQSIHLMQSFEARAGSTKLDGRVKPVKVKKPEKPPVSMKERGYRIPAVYMGRDMDVDQTDALIHVRWPDMTPDFNEYKAHQLAGEEGRTMRIMVSDAERTTSVAYRFDVVRRFQKADKAKAVELGSVYGLQGYRLEGQGNAEKLNARYPVFRNGVEVTDPTPQELKERFSTLYTWAPRNAGGGAPPELYIKCYGDAQVLKAPTCTMTFAADGYLYSVDFRKQHLPEWQAIQQKSIELMKGFKTQAKAG